MADYRFSAQAISRGKGQSSVASAAYRSASRMVDERTGEIHDYTRKSGVLHS
ncbi:MAG: MobA/MobL family protein, partial [Chloroflexi bacterium]|nr:MobA/MobL family protein [Chloroflexota bacterium]